MTLAIDPKMYSEEEVLDQVQAEAEQLFRSGTYFCSEAVLQTINELLGKPYPPEVVKMASGFPIGMGKAQCLCGAVSGGQMALGIVYGRVEGEPMPDKMFEVAKGLHDYVKSEYKSTCCRVITKQWQGDDFKSPERKQHCITITGKVARWVAEKLIKDGQVEVNEVKVEKGA
ncbi:MAG: C-GCAxxG-C-C family protein [Zhaonellaceae bacterium]|jgi:C_GCAxxG_C_C family probable redox protein|nr:C_GCAxxG_C_C family protein [Clostridia bacterium]